MGYHNVQRCLEAILETPITVRQQRQIENSLLNSTQMLLNYESL